VSESVGAGVYSLGNFSTTYDIRMLKMRREDFSKTEAVSQRRLLPHERRVVDWAERKTSTARGAADADPERLRYGPEGFRLLWASRANLPIAFLIGPLLLLVRVFVPGGSAYLAASSPILAIEVVLLVTSIVRIIQHLRTYKAFRANLP
jgi:hypothetical protein